MKPLNRIFATALEVQEFCTSRGFAFCFIGGVAVQRWGKPRLTLDVDLTLLTGFGGEAPFVDEILKRFPGRQPDARSFALQHRVLLVQNEEGVKIDVALGAIPFEERSVSRSSPFKLKDGFSLVTCSAEDLIVHKAFADRPRDWGDIEGIAQRGSGRLDESLIFDELRPLLELKGTPEVEDRLRRVIADARPPKS